MGDQTAHDLLGLLAKERVILASGSLDEMEALNVRKESLLAALPDAKADQSLMQKISDAVARNQKLLTAAIKGVTAAQDHLRQISEMQTRSSVYQQNGAIAKMTVRKPQHSHKA